jgi:IrrE N-terminal-like domain
MDEGQVSRNTRNRLLHFEDCAHAIDLLFRSALEKQGADAFDDFLGFAERFNNLSVYNAMLVRLQRPGAVMVGSRRQWRGIGRQVLPDAIPIVILWPFGPVLFLFELNDTAGEPLPGQSENPLFAQGTVAEELYPRAINGAVNFAVEVEETDHYGDTLAGTAAGLGVCPERVIVGKQSAFRIKLNAKHDIPTKFATLAHELGHIYCGHLGADAKGRWPDRRTLSFSKKAMELEAEAVSWLVCQRNGIATRSKKYLNTLIDEAGLQSVSIYAIYEAANRVESRTVPKKT